MPLQSKSKGNWETGNNNQKQMAENRNASLNLQKFVISVVLVGIILVLGIYISDVISNQVDDPLTSVTVLNESVTLNALNNPVTLSASTAKEVACGALTSATNATNVGVSILTANFTRSGCTIVNATKILGYAGSNVWNASNTVFVSYTYTYTNETASSTAGLAVVSALSTGTSWISILVVVGFATVILTMLTSGLGSAARKEDGVPYY